MSFVITHPIGIFVEFNPCSVLRKTCLYLKYYLYIKALKVHRTRDTYHRLSPHYVRQVPASSSCWQQHTAWLDFISCLYKNVTQLQGSQEGTPGKNTVTTRNILQYYKLAHTQRHFLGPCGSKPLLESLSGFQRN